MNVNPKSHDSFHVPPADHLLACGVHRMRRLWTKLGNLESASLRAQLDSIVIDRPVYVTGLARAGTTIMLEFLAGHDEAASHRYRDFHGIFVPYWWGKAQSQKTTQPLRERAHGDGLQVTPDSPEAMEECLWMAFFRDAHNPAVSSVLTAATEHPAFETFYRDHLRKLLLVRGRSRYVCKGNYNLTRLQYLQKLLPDARFVVVVRDPRDHVASLMRQHALFCRGETKHPRSLAYMRHVGHFEFGLDRRPINVDDAAGAAEVQQLCQRGEEARGLARYWANVYGWFAEQLQQDPQLAEAVHVVRFEDLCAAPESTLTRIQHHCQLGAADVAARFAEQIQAPRRTTRGVTPEDEAIIVEETQQVAQAFGYFDALSATTPPAAPQPLGMLS